MNTTLNFPDDMPTFRSLIGKEPDCFLHTTFPTQLTMPPFLYDPAIPAGRSSPLDVLVPVVAIQMGDQMEVVDGCKRLARTQAVQRPLTVVVIDPASTQPDYCRRLAGLLRLALNRCRSLHLREKLRFGLWLHMNIAEETVRYHASRELGFPDNEMRWISSLVGADPLSLEAVAADQISLELAPQFMQLSAEDRQVWVAAFGGLELSFQTQRELLEWLPEIAFRENTSISCLLQTSPIKNALGNTTLNSPQRIAALREAVFARRFPRYSSARSKWLSLATRINPDPAIVRFIPSPSFERDKLQINVSLTTASQGVRIFGRLAQISAESWQQLICPIE